MGSKEINIFFLSLTLTIFLLVMAVYFIIMSFRRRQLFFTKEKENIELQHRQNLLEAKQEIQQTLMQRLGSELHDTIGQKLTLAYLQMENALNLENIQAIKEHIRMQNNLIQESLDELRSLSKILVSHDFSDFSFIYFLDKEMKRVQESGLCNAVFIAPGNIIISDDERVELTLARICQEFIQNSLKYSGCTEIRIEITSLPGMLEINCSDNGKGMVNEQVYEIKSGTGIRSINTRVALLGATCEWSSRNGTQLKISLPVKLNPAL